MPSSTEMYLILSDFFKRQLSIIESWLRQALSLSWVKFESPKNRFQVYKQHPGKLWHLPNVWLSDELLAKRQNMAIKQWSEVSDALALKGAHFYHVAVFVFISIVITDRRQKSPRKRSAQSISQFRSWIWHFSQLFSGTRDSVYSEQFRTILRFPGSGNGFASGGGFPSWTDFKPMPSLNLKFTPFSTPSWNMPGKTRPFLGVTDITLQINDAFKSTRFNMAPFSQHIFDDIRRQDTQPPKNFYVGGGGKANEMVNDYQVFAKPIVGPAKMLRRASGRKKNMHEV